MSIEIKSGVPVPTRRVNRVSGNLNLLRSMSAGDMFEWEGRNPTGWHGVARKGGVKITVRNLGGGKWGIWRVE